jgi:hypothetical protein
MNDRILRTTERMLVTSEAPPFRPPPNASRRERAEWEKQMLRFLLDQLDERIAQEVMETTNHGANNLGTVEEMAIRRARAGNPDGLRRLYPQFADCIHPPPLRQGQKYPKFSTQQTVAAIAADYAKLIRAIWRERCHQRNRTRDEKRAEDFAVEICKLHFPKKAAGLTTEAVLAAAKPSGKRTKPRRKITRQKAEVAR